MTTPIEKVEAELAALGTQDFIRNIQVITVQKITAEESYELLYGTKDF